MDDDFCPSMNQIPVGWDLVPFGECCTRVADTLAPSECKGKKYLGLEHLQAGFPALIGIGDGSDIASTKAAFRRDDVLFGKLRPYLRKGLRVDFEGVCSTDILTLRAKERTLPEFLGYLIHTDPFVRQANRTTSGVNHPRTSWDGLRRFQVLRPPVEEQRQIATVLAAVHTAIELQERLISLTIELKKALMHKLFTEGTRGEPLRHTEIGKLPQSWTPTPVGTCCSIGGSSMSYMDFIHSPEAYDDAVLCMAVKVSDMNLPGNETTFITANAIKRLPIATARRKLVPPRSVILPKRGAAIATNKKRLTTTWTALDPNLISLHARVDLDPQFLFYWSQIFDLRTITDPGPTPQLNKKDLVPVKLPLPQADEQRDIVTILDAVSRKWLLHRRKHAALSELFSALLHQLMTAQLRVNDLDLSALAGMEQGRGGNQ